MIDWLQSLADALPLRVYWKDRDSRYLGCNGLFAQDAGLGSAAEIVGRYDTDLPWSDLAERYRRDDLRLIETGEARLNYKEPSRTAGQRVVSRVGSKIPLRGEDGEIFGVVGVYESISLAENNEHDYRDLFARYKDVVNQSPVATQIVNTQGFSIYVNKAWERMWGVGIEALDNYSILNDKQLIDAGVMPAIEKALQGETVFVQPIAYDKGQNPNVVSQGVAWVQTRVYPLLGAERTVQALVLLHEDVSEQIKVASALRESDGRFRDLFEKSPDPCWIIDENGLFLMCNRAASDLLGYNHPDDLRGVTPGAISPEHQPDGRLSSEKANEMFALAHEKGVKRFEWIHSRRDGTVFPVEVTLAEISIGGQRRLYCIWRDVSERKKQEQTLREIQVRHEEAQRIAGLGHWVLDFREQQLLWSDEVFRIFGVTKESFVVSEASFSLMIHPEDRAMLWEAFEKAVSTRTRYDCEHRIVRPDGSIRWVRERAETLYDDSGNRTVSKGTVLDITERKLAEEKLRSSNEVLGRIITNASEGISVCVLKELPARVEFSVWNDQMSTITGYTMEQINEASLVDVLFADEDIKVRAIERIVAIRLGDHMKNEEWPIVTRGGETRIVSISTSSIRLADGRRAVVNLVHDVTKRRHAEEEQIRLREQLHATRKLESVGRLAGGVAHDFNNMLGVIMGRVMLAMDQLGPYHPARADLQEVLEAAERSAALTRQLLAFARRQTVSPIQLDLNEKISDTLRMLRRLIGEDIELEWAPADVLHLVKIDPSQVDQILANLCVNARDAIHRGGKIRIETCNVVLDAGGLSSTDEIKPGPFVQLSVTDNGSGMEEDVLRNIFEPFYTTKEVGKGTGLGLATVYGIVKQNAGHIDVSSKVGKGTTFRVFLPAYHPTDEMGISGTFENVEQSGRETILLVEDEPSVMKLTKRLLERMGYRVLAASKASEAIVLIQRESGPIDLLLTDVIMPEMSGWGLAEVLLKERPALKILFMSGYPADVIAEHGVLVEGVQFLQKPFVPQTLSLKVRELLDK